MGKRIVMVRGLDGVTKCDHEWVYSTSGGMHFTGEPWDDIKIEVVCKNCGVELPEEKAKLEEIENIPF